MSDLGAKNGVYLGSIAKSSPPLQPRGFQSIPAYGFLNNSAAFSGDVSVDVETGEIIEKTAQYCPVSARLERFELQSAVRHLLPESRTAKCLRYVHTKGEEVGVYKNKEGSTFFSGLQVCASVWACPCCAAKISERRRVEVLQAIEKHEAAGGQVLLLTLTNPHTKTDDLSDMLKAQAQAMRRFNSTKAACKLWKSIDCVGTIRAYEVTHGVNGWHPHFHILIFCNINQNPLELYNLRERFFDLWSNCCRLAGLAAPSFEHGVDLQDGIKASEYVTKGVWGLDREMTKGHLKKAKTGGRSPFDLLRSYAHDNDKQAGALFVEYATVFKGRRQLVWSKGLKALFLVSDRTDEETAAAQEDDAVLLGMITFSQWRAIRFFNVRGHILELGRFGGWEAIICYIEPLERDYQKVKIPLT